MLQGGTLITPFLNCYNYENDSILQIIVSRCSKDITI
jgi:hypothetical protein